MFVSFEQNSLCNISNDNIDYEHNETLIKARE